MEMQGYGLVLSRRGTVSEVELKRNREDPRKIKTSVLPKRVRVGSTICFDGEHVGILSGSRKRVFKGYVVG